MNYRCDEGVILTQLKIGREPLTTNVTASKQTCWMGSTVIAVTIASTFNEKYKLLI
jgi:hypothetical protein